MNEFTKNQKAMAFYCTGRSCVKSAQFLFDNNQQHYDLLLIQGIELLLKSFIIIKDNNITEDDLRKRYNHQYYKAFLYCKELDNDKIFTDPQLETEIKYLNDFYESSYTNLRYPSQTKMRRFPPSIFKTVNDLLIHPMHRLAGMYYQLAKIDEGPLKDVDRELGIKRVYDL